MRWQLKLVLAGVGALALIYFAVQMYVVKPARYNEYLSEAGGVVYRHVQIEAMGQVWGCIDEDVLPPEEPVEPVAGFLVWLAEPQAGVSDTVVVPVEFKVLGQLHLGRFYHDARTDTALYYVAPDSFGEPRIDCGRIRSRHPGREAMAPLVEEFDSVSLTEWELALADSAIQ